MTKPKINRLDIAALNLSNDLSRSSIAKLIESGYVKVNNKVIKKTSYHIKDNDNITINYNFNKPLDKIKLKIIYQDDDVVVIDKPVGILSHSKGTLNQEPTIASWLKDIYHGPIENNRTGIVHRLDRSTSGVMICAKNIESTKWLQKQFSERKVKKTYVAIITGHLNIDHAIIDLPIERNPKKPQTFRINSAGKSAITEYTVIEHKNELSLIELKPTTGRTHQLRVHLAHLGHPIVGDNIYNGVKANRLYLHAQSLEITLPSKERKIFTSPLPKEFKIYLNNG